jgi:hypothetical protein
MAQSNIDIIKKYKSKEINNMDINQIEELYNNYNIDIVKDIKRLENFIVLDKQKKQILYNQYKQQKKENEIIEYEKQLKKDQEKRIENMKDADPEYLIIKDIPSKNKRDYWIYHYNNNNDIIDYETHGKWLLYYNIELIDDKWNFIKNLYDNNELNGIEFLKVSTFKENSNASDPNIKLICLYCSGDKDNIINIGNNIKNKIGIYSRDYIYFKSDKQGINGNYRINGTSKNYEYKLKMNNDINYFL